MTPTDTKSETPRTAAIMKAVKDLTHTVTFNDEVIYKEIIENGVESLETELNQTKALLERMEWYVKCEGDGTNETPCTDESPCSACKLLSDYAALTNEKEGK